MHGVKCRFILLESKIFQSPYREVDFAVENKSDTLHGQGIGINFVFCAKISNHFKKVGGTMAPNPPSEVYNIVLILGFKFDFID